MEAIQKVFLNYICIDCGLKQKTWQKTWPAWQGIQMQRWHQREKLWELKLDIWSCNEKLCNSLCLMRLEILRRVFLLWTFLLKQSNPSIEVLTPLSFNISNSIIEIYQISWRLHKLKLWCDEFLCCTSFERVIHISVAW